MECSSKLNEVDNKNKVPLIWFPSQSEIKENKEANILPRKGA